MVKQCQRCNYGHVIAVPVPEGQEMKKEWKCEKGHQITNPYAMTDCEDFQAKPSFKKP